MLVDRRYDIARRWSNRELRKLAPLFAGAVVNVSGWDDRDKEGSKYRTYFTAATSYRRTNYAGKCGYQGDPDEEPLDLTQALPDRLRGRFDVVFNHTTLEHIFDVRAAFSNLCALSRDVVIVVVPFSQVQHETDSFGDFWRFTPTCLRRLFADEGFTVIYEAESPHRDAAIYLLFVASRHPETHRGRLPRWRPVERAGKWIGARPVVSAYQFLANKARRALGLRNPYE